MKATVQLDILSLENKIFSGLTEMVVVPGVLGEIGILPGHTPFLTMIDRGPIRIILHGGRREIYYVSGGILEVRPNEVTVLADTIVRAADLDEAESVAAREQAKRVLFDKKSNVGFTNALAQISQAAAKLRAIKLSRNSTS